MHLNAAQLNWGVFLLKTQCEEEDGIKQGSGDANAFMERALGQAAEEGDAEEQADELTQLHRRAALAAVAVVEQLGGGGTQTNSESQHFYNGKVAIIKRCRDFFEKNKGINISVMIRSPISGNYTSRHFGPFMRDPCVAKILEDVWVAAQRLGQELLQQGTLQMKNTASEPANKYRCGGTSCNPSCRFQRCGLSLAKCCVSGVAWALSGIQVPRTCSRS
jgi:hypothetical protein